MSRSHNETTEQITVKESIKKAIRHAIYENKNKTNYHNTEQTFSFLNFSNKEELKQIFLNNFRASGGLYILCHKQNLEENLIRLLQAQKIHNILPLNDSLTKILENRDFHLYPSLPKNNFPDAVVTFANILIAANGSIMFSPSFSHYPTLKNLSKNIIVIAKEKYIIPEFSKAIELMDNRENNKKIPWELVEFIKPTHIENDEFTPENPRIILLLISEQE